MSFEITALPFPAKSKNPHSLAALVQHLRRYTKKSIINAGVAQLWDVHHHKAANPQLEKINQLLNAYGPKIILLGMATANNYRSNTLTAEGFYAFCYDYLGLNNSLNSPSFITLEAEMLLELLKVEKERIPEKYLNIETLKKSCAELFICRYSRAQNKDFRANINELNQTFYIFSSLNNATEWATTKLSEKIFGIEPLHFIRSAFALY